MRKRPEECLSHICYVFITQTMGDSFLYNQSIIIGLLYLLPEIMQIARKRTLVKRKRGNGMTAFDDARQGPGCSYISDIRFDIRSTEPSLKLELHLCGFDYTKYPPEKLEKPYEYLFGETTAFCNRIESKRKFSEAIKI